jgi:DNA-binding MarR family transcriptional regulator
MSGPRAALPTFDEVVHAPLRLQLCALLAPVESLDFATARETLSVSDSVLSKHVKVLTAAGYVQVSKGREGSRTRTWLALTGGGRRALEGHLAALEEISAMATRPPGEALGAPTAPADASLGPAPPRTA